MGRRKIIRRFMAASVGGLIKTSVAPALLYIVYSADTLVSKCNKAWSIFFRQSDRRDDASRQLNRLAISRMRASDLLRITLLGIRQESRRARRRAFKTRNRLPRSAAFVRGMPDLHKLRQNWTASPGCRATTRVAVLPIALIYSSGVPLSCGVVP